MKKIVCLMVLVLVLAGARIAFCISQDLVPPSDSITQVGMESVHDLMTSDSDGDGIVYSDDNCPNVANPDQENMDGDAKGDACDTDNDNDGVADADDTCPLIANDDQADGDGDGVGDACDGCPEDANVSHQDAAECEGVVVESDTDGDGILDGQDSCIDQVGTDENQGCPADLDLSPPAEIRGYDEGGCSLIPDASKGWLGFVLIGLGLIPLLRRRDR